MSQTHAPTSTRTCSSSISRRFVGSLVRLCQIGSTSSGEISVVSFFSRCPKNYVCGTTTATCRRRNTSLCPIPIERNAHDTSAFSNLNTPEKGVIGRAFTTHRTLTERLHQAEICWQYSIKVEEQLHVRLEVRNSNYSIKSSNVLEHVSILLDNASRIEAKPNSTDKKGHPFMSETTPLRLHTLSRFSGNTKKNWWNNRAMSTTKLRKQKWKQMKKKFQLSHHTEEFSTDLSVLIKFNGHLGVLTTFMPRCSCQSFLARNVFQRTNISQHQTS